MESTDVRDVFRLAGTTLEGRFTVERVVAEGGFGVVYHGQQAALERPIALKVLKTPPRYNDVARQQFLAGFAAEAKTIARITHPNIVLVYDFGVSDMPSGERAAWMALEWLTGQTLDDELMRRRGQGGRTPAEVLELLRPALAALAVVHAAGVAHRDLKPANIMLVAGPGGPTPKVVDFGIAKIMEADEAPGSGRTVTRSGQIAFSPGYASPEQVSQGRSGPWTDVHALGLMLTEMLTDRAALEGDETALIFQQIVDRVRPTPAKFGVNVGAWEGVLRRALAVSPSERYRDATELLQALDATVAEAMATQGILSRPSLGAVESGPLSSNADGLALMSTQHAPVGELPAARAVTPVRNVTTNTPTSDRDAISSAPRRQSKASVYAAFAALAGALVLGAGYAATSTKADRATAATGLVPPPASVVAATPTAPPEPTMSASAVAASPSASTSSVASVSSPAAPGVQPATPARASGPSHSPTAPQSGAPARPKQPARVVIE